MLMRQQCWFAECGYGCVHVNLETSNEQLQIVERAARFMQAKPDPFTCSLHACNSYHNR